jgi:hypothetical protein
LDKREDKLKHKEISSSDILGLYEIAFSEYGWSFWDLQTMPIPSFFDTIEALKRRKEEELKAHKKAMKKGKRKR